MCERIFALRIASARSSFTNCPDASCLRRVPMVRVFTAAIFLSCFTVSASAQTSVSAGGDHAKQCACCQTCRQEVCAKAKASAKPAAESGPCQIGVIPLHRRLSSWYRSSVSRYSANEYTEVPTNGWGLDDLVVARVRAAAPGMSAVRRIAYPEGRVRNRPRHKPRRYQRCFATGMQSRPLPSGSHHGQASNCEALHPGAPVRHGQLQQYHRRIRASASGHRQARADRNVSCSLIHAISGSTDGRRFLDLLKQAAACDRLRTSVTSQRGLRIKSYPLGGPSPAGAISFRHLGERPAIRPCAKARACGI